MNSLSEPAPIHMPVLAEQVVEHFSGDRLSIVVDCTLGLGGHSRLLLERHPQMRLIGLDMDDQNLSHAREILADHAGRIRLVRADFADLDSVLADLEVRGVDAILADLGVSSNQIADPDRGLSFDLDGPLDMRLDRRRKTTAADLVNTLSEGELSDLLYFQSQERHSRKIARRICQVRRQGRINSTVALARLVASAVGENPDSHRGRIHPATRTFMALRRSVNRETESLQRLLGLVPGLLREEGRVAIISFHSGEDSLVKKDFRGRSREGIYRILTKKPIVADESERLANPRSRSAKMRVAERMSGP
ncbi:MAG: 16S rRNA (cytosine(1402)-N(4))-methyltransferase RsmH [Phycisphaerales bacterium]|nr:16S rRNA (cytosine(1402)-N(4))-methyltransferase RsmH [Phycisphaerales bacterium]